MIDFKNYLAKGALRKGLGQNNAQNQITVNKGIGKKKETSLGYFVVSRKLNMPEMCFNQNFSDKDRQFQSNAAGKWQLVNEKIGCHLCQKQKQVVILFDANDKSKFKEVKDKQFCDFLK